MNLKDIPVPEVYKESADFRFFINWIAECFGKVKYDTENLIDLLDPQRCPSWLLWLLGDTKGYKYDDRVIPAMNRLIILYFMSLIRNKGSRTGMILAAELNLAQFNLNDYASENKAYEDRIADTSIPVNSAYVASHVDKGYIDVVYFAEKEPLDVCIEYVRPLGMYCFKHVGVRVDSRTKVSIDARLTDSANIHLPIGPTRVGHYRRADYASLQRMVDNEGHEDIERRHEVYYRNSDYEKTTTGLINPGYRALYSLQIANNEHIVKALIPSDPIFSLGYGPQDIGVVYPDNYLEIDDYPDYNLRYDRALDESITKDVYVNDPDRTPNIVNPRPAVNPVMSTLGDAMSMNKDNTVYTMYDADQPNKYKQVNAEDIVIGEQYEDVENGVITQSDELNHIRYTSTTSDVPALTIKG